MFPTTVVAFQEANPFTSELHRFTVTMKAMIGNSQINQMLTTALEVVAISAFVFSTSVWGRDPIDDATNVITPEISDQQK